MDKVKEELIKMLNRGLELEHAARIQYLAHAEMIKGVNAEKIIERLKEIASDEGKHEEKFRTMIAGYLGGEPGMAMSKTQPAKELKNILSINLQNEKEAADFYNQIYKKLRENREAFKYEFSTLEHEIRHIIIDEEEHIVELSLLLG
ncbi:MAG: ferritin-like domain-containing protein [bacterium]|nr:ferritin-like domain-containing protein [bacterium]